MSSKNIRCPYCNGAGHIYGLNSDLYVTSQYTCNHCMGTGITEMDVSKEEQRLERLEKNLAELWARFDRLDDRISELERGSED